MALLLALQQPSTAGQQFDSARADTAILLEAACDTAPRILSGPPLEYPQDLWLHHKQGLVVVQFVLDTTGRVEPHTRRVITTPHLGFNLAAKEYVQKAQFSPGIFHGRKVRTLVQFPVMFRIGEPPR